MKYLLFIIVLTIAANIQAQNSLRHISNPYASVDWDNHGQYKYSLHNHTTASDGEMTLAELIAEYVRFGYSIVAITDHDDGRGSGSYIPDRDGSIPGVFTWPWTDYGVDPDEVGIVAIQGNEISSDVHHIGSYFNDFRGMINCVSTIMREIGLRGGLAIFCHPGRYNHPFNFYYSHFLDFSHLVGLEIITRMDRHPEDRVLWDRLLSASMPERNIWGFGSDDVHLRGQIGNSWNVMLLPELNQEEVRYAKENGNFFVVSRITIANATGEPPAIKRINHARDSGTVEIVAERYSSIRWISQGNVIHAGAVYNYRECGAVRNYFRAVVTGAGGEVFTQPFGVFENEIRQGDVRETNLQMNTFPNPFSPVTTINYALSGDFKMFLGVYDVMGSLIEEIHSGFQTSGAHTISFDGSHLPNGVYFVRLKAGYAVLDRKILLIK